MNVRALALCGLATLGLALTTPPPARAQAPSAWAVAPLGLGVGQPVDLVAVGGALFAIGDDEHPLSARGRETAQKPPIQHRRREVGLYQSTDGGERWTRLPNPPEIPTFGYLQRLASHDGRLYVGGDLVQVFDPKKGTWATLRVDREATFNPFHVAAGGARLPLVAWTKDGQDAQLYRLDPRTGAFSEFARVTGLDQPTLAVADGAVFTIVGGGGDAALLVATADAPRFTAVKAIVAPRSVVAAPGLVLVQTGAGVVRSADEGGTWADTVGLPAARLEALTPFPGGWLVTTAQGIFRSLDQGVTWDLTLPLDPVPGHRRHVAVQGDRAVALLGPERWQAPLEALRQPPAQAAGPALKARVAQRLPTSGWTVAGAQEVAQDGMKAHLWQLTRGERRAVVAWLSGPSAEATLAHAKDTAAGLQGSVHHDGTQALVVAVPGNPEGQAALLAHLTGP